MSVPVFLAYFVEYVNRVRVVKDLRQNESGGNEGLLSSREFRQCLGFMLPLSLLCFQGSEGPLRMAMVMPSLISCSFVCASHYHGGDTRTI